MTTKLFCIALLAAASMCAEMSQKLIVQIPFGFHVGNSTLPSGEYTVDTDAGTHLIRLRSADWKSAVMILTNAVQTYPRPTEGKLIFTKYGDEYFLSSIWQAGNDTGNELSKSRREREVAAISRRGAQTIVASK
jgi:hypothetical protein